MARCKHSWYLWALAAVGCVEPVTDRVSESASGADAASQLRDIELHGMLFHGDEFAMNLHGSAAWLVPSRGAAMQLQATNINRMEMFHPLDTDWSHKAWLRSTRAWHSVETIRWESVKPSTGQIAWGSNSNEPFLFVVRRDGPPAASSTLSFQNVPAPPATALVEVPVHTRFMIDPNANPSVVSSPKLARAALFELCNRWGIELAEVTNLERLGYHCNMGDEPIAGYGEPVAATFVHDDHQAQTYEVGPDGRIWLVVYATATLLEDHQRILHPTWTNRKPRARAVHARLWYERSHQLPERLWAKGPNAAQDLFESCQARGRSLRDTINGFVVATCDDVRPDGDALSAAVRVWTHRPKPSPIADY
jgi:hypothetical protein